MAGLGFGDWNECTGACNFITNGPESRRETNWTIAAADTGHADGGDVAGSVATAALQAAAAQLLPDAAAGSRVPAPLRHRARREPGLQAAPAGARRPSDRRRGVQAQILPRASVSAVSIAGR